MALARAKFKSANFSSAIRESLHHAKISRYTVYVHCFAHRLNLVLVDSCKSISAAADFFSLLETLYTYISSSIPHSDKQSELGHQKEIQLVIRGGHAVILQ